VFGAKPPKHTSSVRSLIFSQYILDRMKDTYEMDIEIKVDFETHETLETLSGDIDSQSTPDNEDTKENSINNEESVKNIEESEIKENNNINQDSEEWLDPLSSHNVSQASQVSQQSDCDLRNQESADRFMAEVERLSKEEPKK
jgi:hypothetical protein